MNSPVKVSPVEDLVTLFSIHATVLEFHRRKESSQWMPTVFYSSLKQKHFSILLVWCESRWRRTYYLPDIAVFNPSHMITAHSFDDQDQKNGGMYKKTKGGKLKKKIKIKVFKPWNSGERNLQLPNEHKKNLIILHCTYTYTALTYTLMCKNCTLAIKLHISCTSYIGAVALSFKLWFAFSFSTLPRTCFLCLCFSKSLHTKMKTRRN